MLFPFSYCQADFKQCFIKEVKSMLQRPAIGEATQKTENSLLSALTGFELKGHDFNGQKYV